MAAAESYAGHAMIRMVNRKVNVDHIENDDLEDVSKTFSVPLINSLLKGYGAPFASGSVPEIVKMADAYFTMALVFDDVFSQTAKRSGWSEMIREQFWKMIGKIKAREIEEEHLGTPDSVHISEADADRPETEVFTEGGADGSELNWKRREEERET